MKTETKPTAENTPAVFEAAQRIAKSWRCWDRTDGGSTEQRIIDGCTWAILHAIDQGEIPGLVFLQGHDDLGEVEVVPRKVMERMKVILRSAKYSAQQCGDSYAEQELTEALEAIAAGEGER